MVPSVPLSSSLFIPHNAFESLRDPGLYFQALGLVDGCALSQNLDVHHNGVSVTVLTSESSTALLSPSVPWSCAVLQLRPPLLALPNARSGSSQSDCPSALSYS